MPLKLLFLAITVRAVSEVIWRVQVVYLRGGSFVVSNFSLLPPTRSNLHRSALLLCCLRCRVFFAAVVCVQLRFSFRILSNRSSFFLGRSFCLRGRAALVLLSPVLSKEYI